MAPVKSVILGSAAALISFGLASATSCSGPVINSISYCNPVDQIKYDNIVSSGSYNDVIGMDLDSCTCSYAPKPVTGSPLDEGLSLHFRGPLQLKQFAVYYPAPPKQKRSHAHKHLGHHHAHHKRAMVDKPTSEYSDDGVTLPEGLWVRKAYYDGPSQTVEGLVFMNHRGGQGSGVWDKCGSSISYMSSDTTVGAKNPQILQNAPIKSRDEFMIFSDEECDDSCGFSRPGIPAFKGFAGSKKIFVFEFSMPDDVTPNPNNDPELSFNDNMPAIWALNSKIPRTSQYVLGQNSCSCWSSGCGELDLFEVLKDATPMCKSHFHSKKGAGGGDPNYFPRPVNGFVKYAVYFNDDNSATITKLPDSLKFPKKFSGQAIIANFTGLVAGILSSIFSVPQN
ncbi:hypothetical protein L211DRAFT_896906 [Terfezia boudieri ATCC MYA-4762]|uniref:glucan endo-1,3-beta-D-glucosidase n=1 Tax=Terfezia boudieri ATCC MYA-4762 TaxID=1051890 RepID=A0A3N4LW30_9PEZI|nr:hypothetical protein L211DRAFT_896906 [Terfezia boudieri ATCC MYA-4762]